MRIFVLSDLWMSGVAGGFPGGAERYLYNLANQLRIRGHEINVLTSYHAAKGSEGISVEWQDIGVRSQSEARHESGWKIIKKAIESFQANVILTHHFFAFEFEQELAALGIPVVQCVYNNRRMDCAALAVYVSEYVRAMVLKARDNSKPEDMTIIPPAFDDVRAEAHGNYIGFIKPIPHKGVEFFYQLADAMPEREFLVLMGEWRTLEVIRQKPNVRFMAPVADMRDFYKHVRIMLVPSLSEDAGSVGQEAAVNRIPCISSDAGGLPETNHGIRCGLNVALWKEEIQTLDDPAYYAMVSHRQTRRLSEFQWPEKFNQLSERITALVGVRW